MNEVMQNYKAVSYNLLCQSQCQFFFIWHSHSLTKMLCIEVYDTYFFQVLKLIWTDNRVKK